MTCPGSAFMTTRSRAASAESPAYRNVTSIMRTEPPAAPIPASPTGSARGDAGSAMSVFISRTSFTRAAEAMPFAQVFASCVIMISGCIVAMR